LHLSIVTLPRVLRQTRANADSRKLTGTL
jgi:hypothetical protein